MNVYKIWTENLGCIVQENLLHIDASFFKSQSI